jgi:hypothetical protein
MRSPVSGLAVNRPGDRYEQEADRVADQVMRMPDPATAQTHSSPSLAARVLQRKCDCGVSDSEREASNHGREANGTAARVIGPSDDSAEREADAIANAILAGKAHGKPSQITAAPIQAKGKYGAPCNSGGGEIEERKPDETPVQAKREGGSANSHGVLSSRLDARHGVGEPLPAAIRRNFESQLGVPLGGVQVHHDAEAGELARSIGALAFAAGQDVYFAPGRYAPDTPFGAHLIAHELVHVAQQGSDGRNTPIRRFTLKGFDPGQETQMRAAVTSAKSKITACTGKGIPEKDIASILRGLDQADYVFVSDLDDCGGSNKLTDTIKIGPAAFKYDVCCDLDSTLAHECAHSFAWGFEKFARNVECQCFGCSCNWKS